MCNWYAKRDEDYASRIIRDMKRQKHNARDRVLTENELHILWNEADGLFGNFTKLALLTGQRREKLLTMRYDDLSQWGVVYQE
jgi:integrase